MDFSSTPAPSIRIDLWLEKFVACDDQQLVSHLRHGVCSQSHSDFTSMMAPPLLSMGDGIHSMEAEIDRLVGEGYLLETHTPATWPVFIVPNGAVPKKGSETWRRISDHGHPQGRTVTEALQVVMPPNQLTKWFLQLPKELKPMHQDLAVDICVLRYQGDLLGWSLVHFSDDMKDWFYQMWQHVSQHWKSTFVFKREGSTSLSYFQETVMGMGYSHTSNIAQRFAITILLLWYEEFRRLDAEFIEAECSRNERLEEILSRRTNIPEPAPHSATPGQAACRPHVH